MAHFFFEKKKKKKKKKKKNLPIRFALKSFSSLCARPRAPPQSARSSSLLASAPSLLKRKRIEKKRTNMSRKTATKTPALIVLVAAAAVNLLFSFSLASAATGQLSVTLEPLKDSPEPRTTKYLASAVSDGWGEPPLGPGAVAFSFEAAAAAAAGSSSAAPSGASSSSGDVHLGLAQATLLLPCGSKGKVTAAFTPTGAKEATSFGARAVEVAAC